jgi:tol-pal system protein YbgF
VLGQEPSRALPRQSALASAESATRRPRGRLVAGLPAAVGLVLLAGCASVADVTGTATQQDLVELRGEIAAAQQAAQRARSDAEGAATRAVDARLRSQGTESERQLTALTRRLDGLTTSLTELVARVDELSARIDALGRQVRGGAPAGPVGAPRTATPVMPGGAGTPMAPGGAATPSGPGSTATPVVPGGTATPMAPSPGVGAPPATATPATPPSVAATPPSTAGTRPATNALTPQDIYQAAYIDFSKGSYSLAMAGFREFLRRFPEHQLAGNAQYWIGESHFSQARGFTNAGQADKATLELEQAVQELRKVVANYPRGEKAPAALYKEALALIELKQPALAQQRLEYLVANFPQAEETPMARERLAAIKPR